MSLEEAVRRWLQAYNFSNPVSSDRYDPRLDDHLFLESDPASRLELALALSREDLMPEAQALLGAWLCEDLLADAPDLLPSIRDRTEREPKLKLIFAFAWETGRMSEEAKAFLREVHGWANLHFPEPVGKYPTEPKASPS